MDVCLCVSNQHTSLSHEVDLEKMRELVMCDFWGGGEKQTADVITDCVFVVCGARAVWICMQEILWGCCYSNRWPFLGQQCPCKCCHDNSHGSHKVFCFFGQVRQKKMRIWISSSAFNKQRLQSVSPGVLQYSVKLVNPLKMPVKCWISCSHYCDIYDKTLLLI